QIRAQLDTFLRMMRDPDMCGKIGCRDAKLLGTVGDRLRYSSFIMDLPFPWKSRQFVFKEEVSEDPQTKDMMISYIATPDKLPADNCCFRVTHMHNVWRFTPQPNGLLKIEYILDVDE